MPGQPQKLLVDTGPLIALFVARDKHHHRAAEFEAIYRTKAGQSFVNHF